MTVTVRNPSTARSGPLRVLVVGPLIGAQGGIGSVQRVLADELSGTVELRHVVTHLDGPAYRRLPAMIIGVARAVVTLLVRPVDVVHLHLSQRLSVLRKGVVVRVARALGVPTVLHAHGSEFLDWFDGLPAPARRLVRALLCPDRVVVLSPRVRDGYRDRLGLGADAVAVLPNPVMWPAEVVREIPEPGATVRVTLLGRLGARKGVYDLVRAVALLPPPIRARVRMVLAGDGEVEAVRRAVAAAGVGDVVDVPGWIGVAERDALLVRSDILALPSSHEGQPMAVLEAMAHGVVPLVTAVGGMRDLVRNGENGVVVPVGDPPAFAAALASLIADPERRRKLGDRARADVADHAGDRWGEQLLAVWRSATAPVAVTAAS